MKAFVTGATGLLGINLIRLLKSKGYQVKALIRSKDKAQKWLGDLDLELIQGDMTRVGDFAPALAGCDVLFHTAAYFNDYYQGNPKSHWEKLKAVNIEGTRSLLEAAEAQQIKKFIYVSSSGTIGQAETNVADESTGADEQVKANLYFKSKVETDQMIETFLQSHSLAVTSLLPGWMFGPFDTVPSAAGRLILDFSQSKLPAQFEGSVMIVDVRDAANALFEAIGLGESGARYLVAGHFVKLTELLELLTKVTRVQAPRLKLAKPLILGLARASQGLSRLRTKPSLLSVDGVKALMNPQELSSAKAQKILHAKFRPLEVTLKDTLEWYKGHGYLSS